MSIIPFRHKMAAHCESGTITALLNHHGLDISEPMVFGIASGIFFGYMKAPMMDFPMFVTRSRPGQIRSKFAKRTGVKFEGRKFRNPAEAQRELDLLLDKNQPVAVQVDFFYMDYFPAWYRVHINVHFINVIGREGNKYIVSDCYHPEIAEIDRETLLKARFAGGSMAPKGFMFYPSLIPEKIDFRKAVQEGIKSATYNMLKIPMPFLGIKGMRRFADKIVDWPKYARDNDQLADKIYKICVFIEDQGTGGGAFRFIYASFLQEASKILDNPKLNDLSKKIMEIGDGWRELAFAATRVAKSRDFSKERLMELGSLIRQKADMEEPFFVNLREEIINKNKQ
jgi:hypothetical protein